MYKHQRCAPEVTRRCSSTWAPAACHRLLHLRLARCHWPQQIFGLDKGGNHPGPISKFPTCFFQEICWERVLCVCVCFFFQDACRFIRYHFGPELLEINTRLECKWLKKEGRICRVKGCKRHQKALTTESFWVSTLLNICLAVLLCIH